MRTLTRTIAIMILLASAAALHARGEAAMDLSFADRLIQEKRFSEAREYLSGMARKYPEHFDNIQERIQRINKIDESYNAYFEELLALYAKGSGNEARKLELRRLMDELNPNPSEAQRRRLDDLRSATAFIEYNRRLRDVFKRAQVAIDAREYARAARIYEESYVLYKAEFDASALGGTLVRDRVNAGLASLKETITAFEADSPAYAALRMELSGTFSGPTAALPGAIETARPSFLRIAEERSRVAAQGRAFRDQFAVFRQADPGLTDSSFLPFAYRATLGWITDDSKPPNGVLGSIDLQFESIVRAALDAALPAADGAFLSLEASYGKGDWADIARAAPDASARARGTEPLLILRLPYYSSDPEPELRAEVAAEIALDAARGQALKHLEDLIALLGRSAAIRERLTALETEARPLLAGEAAESAVVSSAPAPLQPIALATADIAARTADRLLSLYREADAQRLAALSIRAETGRVRIAYAAVESAMNPAPPSWREKQERAESRSSNDIATAENFQAALARAAAGIEYAAASRGMGDQERKIQEGQGFVSGVKSDDPELKDFILKYPDRGISLAAEADANLRAMNLRVKALSAKYQNFPPFVMASEPMKTWMAGAGEGERKTLSLIASAADLAKIAKAQKQQADAARLEADMRIQEARSAIRQVNFNMAKDRVEKAQDRYLDSLALQWDSELKARSEAAARSILGEIDKGLNESIIAEKRRLINQGKAYYNGGEFERAEERFLQAQALHRTRFSDDDPEVAYWYRLAQTAVSIRSGRTIPQTAPLYPEMSQLLSKARLLYEQGRDAIKRNRRTEGIARLGEAKALVGQVKLAFPRNQDASVLGLQIEFLVDADNAERLFRQYFAAATKNVESASQTLQYEGYNELLNLREIRPTWTGMAAAITRAQIRLGIIRPPADPAKIAEARNLVASARSIIEKNNRPLYPDARVMLDKAINLDPENPDAPALVDIILRTTGVEAQSGILSVRDRQALKNAESLYAKGDNAAAYTIVKDIWSNPGNRTDQRVKSLRQKLARIFGDL